MELSITGVLDSIKQRILPTLILLSALSVSGSAAFYSVSGLSKLFAGAALEVMIMAGSLEIAKLVTATLLHRYWKTLSWILKSYLTIAVIILVVITSMGIYGFLSAAYQETFNKLMQRDNKIAFLQEKADFYQSDVSRYEKELQLISENISTLSNAKATSIQVRDTTVAGGVRSTISTAELRLSQKRITAEEANRKEIRTKRDQVADSLQKYQLEILQLKSDTDVAGELGPLEYLSGLTGVPMDKIINWLLLVIVFVFDPLAISLVIAANFAFAQINPKKKKVEISYEEAPDLDDLPPLEDYQEDLLARSSRYDDDMYPPEYYEEQEDLQKLYEIYGETGSVDINDIDVEYEEVQAPDWQIEQEEHSDFEDAQKNVILEEDDPRIRLRELKSYLKKERIGGINRRLERDLLQEIEKLEEELSDGEDDLTKTY